MSKKEIKKESRQKPTPYTIEQREENGGEKAKEPEEVAKQKVEKSIF